jgi:adenine phosphoribosyltransferase
MEIKSYIKEVPDFPKKGINYKDIQPLLADEQAFFDALYDLGELVDIEKIDYFVGIESRGFIFASALAAMNMKGFKMVRKAGKLPSEDLISMEYGLEYGRDTLEMQKGSGNVVIVDDVFATGGTMKAARLICDLAGYNVVDTISLIDIGLIQNHDTKCLISY